MSGSDNVISMATEIARLRGANAELVAALWSVRPTIEQHATEEARANAGRSGMIVHRYRDMLIWIDAVLGK